jgi:hypothetical protein
VPAGRLSKSRAPLTDISRRPFDGDADSRIKLILSTAFVLIAGKVRFEPLAAFTADRGNGRFVP